MRPPRRSPRGFWSHPSTGLASIGGLCLCWSLALATLVEAQTYPPTIDREGFIHSGQWPGGPPPRVLDRADLEYDLQSNRVYWVSHTYHDLAGYPERRPAPTLLHPDRNPYFDEMKHVLQRMHIDLANNDRWAQDQFNRLRGADNDRQNFFNLASANKNDLPIALLIDMLARSGISNQSRQIQQQYEMNRGRIIQDNNGRFNELAARLNRPPGPPPGALPPPNNAPYPTTFNQPSPGPQPARPPQTSSMNNDEFYSPRWGFHFRRIYSGDGSFDAVVSRPPVPGGGAAILGFEPGDRITAMDDLPFFNNQDLENHVGLTTVDFVNVQTNGAERRSVRFSP